MTEYKLIAIDTSKHVFTLHGVDERGQVVLRRELRRQQVATLFGKLPATEVVLEACGSSHHWGRVLTALGHRVRLIPPQYVKPFVKRSKNDRIDAEAISEAAQRPSMHFVPVKSAEAQSEAMILSVRELLVKQQTQLVNALRGHAAEFGVIAAKGTSHIDALLERIAADPAVPAAAKAMSPNSVQRSRMCRRGSPNWTVSWPSCTRPTRSASSWRKCRELVRSVP